MIRPQQAVLLAILLSSGFPVHGQVLEEIIVLAQKREQNLQDVGISVTAFGVDELRVLQLASSVDLGAQVPGLQFVEGQEQLINLVNIRGVSQNDIALHQEGPIAVYMDQSYVSIGSAVNFPLFDLQRIEVLRGPQGTLFGRNATGGLIHYVSREPADEFTANVQFEVGEQDLYRLEGAAGGPLSSRASGRISALYTEHDDYVRNIGVGQDARGRNDIAVRGQLQIDFDDRLSLRLIGQLQEGDTNLASNHSANGFGPDGLEFNLPADLDFWGTCPGCDPIGYRERNDDPYEINTNTDGFYEHETNSLSGILTWDISDAVRLVSVTNALNFDGEHSGETDNSPQEGVILQSLQDSRQFSQEIRIHGQRGAVDWSAGIYFIDRDADQEEVANGSLAVTDVVFSALGFTPPGVLSSLGTELRLDSAWRLKTRSWAGFGHVEYAVSDSLTLIGGIRLTGEELDYRFDSTESIDGFPIGPGGILGETSFIASDDDEVLTGQVAINWAPQTDSLTYFSIAQGHKGGGFTAPFTGGVVRPFDPETLTSFEVGYKTTWLQGRARFNASAFHYDYDDYQGFTFQNRALVITNLDATVDGLEGELDLILGDVRLGLGLSLLDTSVEDVELPLGAVTDRELPLAPGWSVNGRLGKTWNLPQGSFTAQINGSYTDEYFAEVLNAPAGVTNARFVGDLHLIYESERRRWSASLLLRNFTDEEILAYRIPTGQGTTQDHFGSPRWLSVQFGYRWN